MMHAHPILTNHAGYGGNWPVAAVVDNHFDSIPSK